MSIADASERDQINICRVICIFFMMSVHVNPGLSASSVISSGSFHWIGAIWGDFLGRASVAALSFISGYLLIRTASGESLASLARRRFWTLVVPMLSWNLIYCLLQLAKAIALRQPGESVLLQPDGDLLAALTGLTGPTANLSLFFLRDLFVSALLVQLARPALVKWPGPVLALVAFVTVFDLAEPLVFRPAILFFVAGGAIYATRSARLAERLTARVVVPAVVMILAALALLHLLPLAGGGPAAELDNLLRRSLLVILTLVASAQLAGTSIGDRVVPLEKRIFETYLLHVPLIGMLWVPWTVFVGGADGASYAIFFLIAPVLAIVAGRGFGSWCDLAPALLQKLLRGKVRARPGVAVPAE